jgi:hypothetical protein
MATSVQSSLDVLVADLRGIFAARLHAVVIYGRHATGPAAPGTPVHTLVRVESIGVADLEACARRVTAWRREGLAVPLLMAADEFARALDAFPAELGAILNNYRVVFGPDPFDGLAVPKADLRRACEVEARGHLLHLREGFIESAGQPEAIAALVSASAPALKTLLGNLAHLDGSTEMAPSSYATARLGPHHGRTLAAVVALVDTPIASTDAARSFPQYLAATEALVAYIDRWTA